MTNYYHAQLPHAPVLRSNKRACVRRRQGTHRRYAFLADASLALRFAGIKRAADTADTLETVRALAAS
jgi:hypothetical protein